MSVKVYFNLSRKVALEVIGQECAFHIRKGLKEPYTILNFSENVVRMKSAEKGIKKTFEKAEGSILFKARAFTSEAKEVIGKLENSIVISTGSEYVQWTDASDEHIRTLIGAKVKKPSVK